MTDIERDAGATIGLIQTDTFCEGCGYNLHTQAVTRDERLGILICRCPECGRYSAVGQTTTAARVWLNRLATVLLTSWVFFLLVLFALCSFFLGMLAYGHMAEMTEYRPVAPIQTIKPGYADPYRYLRVVKQIPANDADQLNEQWWAQAWLAVLTISLGLITGGLFAVLLWHCKGWVRILAFLPAVLGCGVASTGWISEPQAPAMRVWGLLHIGVYLLIDLLAIGIGLLLGRWFARGLIRVLVPPKPRQHLAFLWLTDGKVLKPN